MAINLTRVKHTLNTVKKNLFFEKGLVLELLDINTVLATISTGWYVSKNSTSNLAIGEEYFEASISDIPRDDVKLEDVIPEANQVRFGNETYKIDQYFRPRGLTKEWLLRLGSLGTRDNG